MSEDGSPPQPAPEGTARGSIADFWDDTDTEHIDLGSGDAGPLLESSTPVRQRSPRRQQRQKTTLGGDGSTPRKSQSLVSPQSPAQNPGPCTGAWQWLKATKNRTTILVNLTAIMERTDEQLLPAVYLFVALSFQATPEQLGYLTLCRAMVQALSSPLGGFLGESDSAICCSTLSSFFHSSP